MRTSTRMIAIACAVATGPLLASAAIGIRDYVSSAPDDEGFSLDGGGFIDAGSGGGITASQGCDEPWISCVVTGGGGDDWWPGGGGLGGGGTGGGSSGGDCSADPSRCEDGGGGETSYIDYLNNQCALDNAIDFQAQQIMNQIKAQPDWNEREYAAVVYLVNGQLKIGSLRRGETYAEALADGRSAPRTGFDAPPDLGDGVILAVVHSHPDIGANDATDILNKYPSVDDYNLFDQTIGSQALALDSRFANNVAFAQYILGPDGVFREFNKVDGRLTPANDPNPGVRDKLWSDRQCPS